MNSLLILALISGLFAITSIIYYFQWFYIYKKKSGHKILRLLKEGVYKPYKIENDKDFSLEVKKKLNKKRIYVFLFLFIAVCLAFVYYILENKISEMG